MNIYDIADVPEVFFKRIDGKIFHYNEITQASANPQVNFTEVNAGHSLYPVAYLPAASSFEITVTSGQFDSSLFALANGGDFEADASVKVPYTETVALDEALSAVLVCANGVPATMADIDISGMEVGSSATSGTVKWDSAGKKITFATGDAAKGDMVDVTYWIAAPDAVSLNVKNDRAAIGEAILRWPRHKWAA